ncbi:MAG: hypothetical protein HY859_09910 [Caulobacterales bacterium]|nr:hypothetical protein [Caulobacterales bacterium]
MIRRTLVAVAALFAIVAQLAVGIAGPNSSICICSTCITIERDGDACCSVTDGATSASDRSTGLLVIGKRGCAECHLVPLPDTTFLPTTSAPIPPVATALPVAHRLATSLVWPPPPGMWARRLDRQRPPTELHLRCLRTVVLTC